MATRTISSLPVGQMAIITGAVYILAAVLLLLFFTVGQPFGTLNDLFNGMAGISSGVLAWMLYATHYAESPLPRKIGIVLAGGGAIFVIIGSVLVISGRTGWVLAGLYTSAGNALIGLWLLTLCYSLSRNNFSPRNLVILGLVAGAFLASGLVVLPGIISGFDSQDATPWFLYIAGLNALSGAILYPIWCIWFGHTIGKRQDWKITSVKRS